MNRHRLTTALIAALCLGLLLLDILVWPSPATVLALVLLVVTFPYAIGLLYLQWRQALKLTGIDKCQTPATSQEKPTGDPSVDIVVAARNEENVIADTLRNLSALDYKHVTVWVVDDASCDKTPSILAQLRHELPGLNVIRR